MCVRVCVLPSTLLACMCLQLVSFLLAARQKCVLLNFNSDDEEPLYEGVYVRCTLLLTILLAACLACVIVPCCLFSFPTLFVFADMEAGSSKKSGGFAS